ncbi:hypothetical protein FJZ21_03865 [Candidatus Pacearchaeota archaeon]|nr:hypothetical protein [Candidatus Pacearchaeota archaeon]
MQNPNLIKLEMAQMSIRGGRFDEGEKMIEDLIFNASLDNESMSIAWFSYGTSKFKRFINSQGTFEEFIYAMNKSFEADNNSAQMISDSTVSMICSLINNYSLIISNCIEELRLNRKEIRNNSILAVGAVVLGSMTDNKYLKYGAYSYGALKGASIIGDTLNSISAQERMNLCKLKLQQILSSISSLDVSLQNLNNHLLNDEILNNKAIQFILETQNSDSIATKILNFYNSLNEKQRSNLDIRSKEEVISLMNSKSIISLNAFKNYSSKYRHLISNDDDILFAIEFKQGAFLKTSGFILFLKDSIIILHILVVWKATVTLEKLLYSDLPLGFMQFESALVGSKLILQYNQQELVFVCPNQLSTLSELFSVQ